MKKGFMTEFESGTKSGYLMKSGFTLIELLVVIGIIALMASFIVAGISRTRASGRDAKRTADINLLAQKIQAYYNDPVNNHNYPVALNVIYLEPKDPSSQAEYKYKITTLNSYPAFELYAILESPSGSNTTINSQPVFCAYYNVIGTQSTICPQIL